MTDPNTKPRKNWPRYLLIPMGLLILLLGVVGLGYEYLNSFELDNDLMKPDRPFPKDQIKTKEKTENIINENDEEK